MPLHSYTSGNLDTMNSKMDIWVVIWIFLYQSLKGSCQQQYFRVQPKDVKVQEGGEATLQCEVTHLSGQVQWTKDGFALGFSHEIPGFPRYKMIGDFKNGVYNLNIINASLEDDAQFQCQVGPNGFHKPIRANANLSVISPPSSIEMVGYQPNAKIEIKENQVFQLECLVKNSKPAAKIVWFRGNVELKLDKREDKIVVVDPSKKAKRYDVSSKISLQPTSEDDFADYTCEARHEALSPEMPLRVTVQLSVLYPPGLPYIEGYTEGETIRRGQNVELVCRSRGGNPPAQLIWYKNGEQIRMAYRTSGRLSENIYSFTADANDNKAKYRCEASNIMSTSPLKADVELVVLFAPIQVTISGPTEARVGDTVPMTCTTASSNPPADIKWMIGGRQVRNATQRTIKAPEGGWFTTSNTSALIGPNQKSLVVICHGLNKQLTENIVSTHTINVLYPPGQPILTGYTKGTHIAAGTLQKISCISSGGNPLATLTWYKNDKKINSVTKTNDRSVSAEVTILANVTDNEAVYKCEASNPATEIPLIERVQLSVHFPPEHVKIKKEPEELRAGTIATLTCDASSSNPPSEMSWWREGISVTEGITNSSKPGLHGGTVSSIQLKLNITPEIDGDVYTCQAANIILQRSVHDAVTMSVLYKPVFNEVGDTEVSGIEGDALVMGSHAVGHPSALTYTWTKDTAPLSPGKDMHIEGPFINFTRLHRTFTGVYTCEAVNNEGSTTISFNLTVFYGGSITATSHGVSVSPKEDAELWCRFEGSPLTQEHITWRRDDFPDMSQRTTITWNNNTSYLTVHEARKEDIGHFQCSINNGYGNETSKNVFLIVKHKPEMDLSPNLLKSASNNGETGRLVCRVSAAPAVNFTWSRTNSVITTDHHKYLIDYKQIDDVHYESIVLIRNIEQSDYGRYECIARNHLGFSTNTVVLALTNSPDPPSNLQIYNVSHDSLTLGWEPGFDGGLPAAYRLRYRPANIPGATYKYEDTGNVTRYTVTGLELGTEYVFSIQAINRLGSSRFLADTLKATTSSVAPPSLPSRGGGSSRGTPGFILILGFILGVILLLLNLLLVGCCLRRRKARLAAAKRVTELPEAVFDAADIPLIIIMAVVSTAATLLIINILVIAFFYYRKRRHGDKVHHEGSSDHGSNKNPPMEMYAPSSYNETVTGETLSSVSEKSESYSDQQDYNDDARKPAASTYLIDQNDYPFQYPGYDIQSQIKDVEPIALHRQPYNNQNGGLGVPSVDNYYTVSPDPRYVAYPPPLQFAQPPLPVSANTRQVPPDVTVLSAPPLLSTFNYSPASHLVEPDSHLV